MDLGKVSDLSELKAMAYDQLVALEQVQNNLRAINARIAEVQNPPNQPPQSPNRAARRSASKAPAQ